MKMKKGLLMVVLLLALSSLMAAMSYSSAKVTSEMTGSVVSTDNALLALKVPKDTIHKATTYKDGILNIDFNKGMGGGNYGLQKDSVYTWDKLFEIKNHSENKVAIAIDTNLDLLPGLEIFVKTSNNSTWQPIKGANFNALTPDQFHLIDVQVVVSKTTPGYVFGNLDLVISGTTVQ